MWRDARADQPDPPLVPAVIDQTARWWQDWVAGLTYAGEWREAVIRSLITIKALTYAPTGGLRRGADHVAAAAAVGLGELGLPVLLAARRRGRARRAAALRGPRRGRRGCWTG